MVHNFIRKSYCLLVFVVISLFTNLGFAKFVPTQVSESILKVDAIQSVYEDRWLRLQKFENHDLIILLRDKALKYESFRILPNSELGFSLFYKDAHNKVISERVKDGIRAIHNESILLQITDERPNEIFKKERSEKMLKKFQIDFELIGKSVDKSFKFSLLLDDVNTNAKTLREDSFMYNWFFVPSR
jgi:hypothetical protein